MNAEDQGTLAERVRALESFNRRLRNLVVILLLVVGSTMWMGQRAARKKAPVPPTPRVIEAEQFLLKVPYGRVLAALGAGVTGPTLRLVGPNGTDRAVVGLDVAGTPHFSLMRADGNEAVGIRVASDGAPTLDV